MASNYEAPKMQTQALNATASPPTLTGVPVEIFELIASHVDEVGLRALRLTCLTSAANVMRTFAKAHFVARSILLCDQESIEDAVRAAKHPDFGRYLCQLAVYVDKVSDLALSRDSDMSTSSRVPQATAEKANFGGSLKTLKHLFQIVQRRGVGLRLVLCDQAAEKPYYSKLSIWREKWRSAFCAPAHDDTEPLELVMAAVSASKVEVHDFTIRPTVWLPLCCFASLASSGNLSLLNGGLLSHVRRLDVCVQLVSSYYFDASLGIETFRDMVAKAPHLRSLRLQDWYDPASESKNAVDAMLAEGLPSLHHLSLDSIWLAMASVQNFVRRSPSLRTLDLNEVDFMPGSFSEEVMSEFKFRDSTDIHEMVRKVIGLPGNYKNLWSDDVEVMDD